MNFYRCISFITVCFMFHAKTTAVQYMGKMSMVVVPGLGVVRDVSRQTNSNPAERDKD